MEQHHLVERGAVAVHGLTGLRASSGKAVSSRKKKEQVLVEGVEVLYEPALGVKPCVKLPGSCPSSRPDVLARH